MQTMRQVNLASDRTAYKKVPIPNHGSKLGTKDNHASTLFQMAKRTTEAGGHSLQGHRKSTGAGMAANETRCLSIQCGFGIITRNRCYLGGYVQSTVYHLISCFESTSRAILFFLKFVALFPECSRSSRSVDIVVPNSHYVSKSLATLYQEISYLSNQFPSTPLAERSPPTWMPSDRHRSSPWKMENVVHRI